MPVQSAIPQNSVLCTIYIDSEIDDRLTNEAFSSKVGKAELFRQYLSTGIGAVNANPNLLEQETLNNKHPLVLRSAHMDSDIEHKLRVEAFDNRVSKNDLIRRYVRIGMSYKIAATTVIAPTPHSGSTAP